MWASFQWTVAISYRSCNRRPTRWQSNDSPIRGWSTSGILDAFGRDHPLINLMLGCLHNSPAHHPETVEILTQVSRVAAQFPSSSKNKVELLQQLTSLRERPLQQANRFVRQLCVFPFIAHLQLVFRADTESLQQEISSLIHRGYNKKTGLWIIFYDGSYSILEPTLLQITESWLRDLYSWYAEAATRKQVSEW